MGTTYFVTGATGFIGGRLVERLLARKGSTVLCLVRAGSEETFDDRVRNQWGTTRRRVKPVIGDLSQKDLGLDAATIKELTGTVDHLFHVAAIYDLEADAESQVKVNVEGTRAVVNLANKLKVTCLHHVSSIAAAGSDFKGTFSETMFEEAEGLAHPYFATKHDSEGIVRRDCTRPYRIYRPAIVVGDSRTGEIDKIDGPYYMFRLIQRLREMFPQWMPLVGVEGRIINIVPVDYVVDAMDHIAHMPEDLLDGRVFHLTDPEPQTVGEVMNIFARAAHAPQFQMRLDPMAFKIVPKNVRKMLGNLPPVKRSRQAIMGDLDMPEEILRYLDWPTQYTCDNTIQALEGSGIECPPLESYAWKLWDHWERTMDPALFVDRSLRGSIEDKVVLITGASAGIGKQVALDAGAAGAHVVLVARTESKLVAVKDEIEADGGTASVYPCDLTDMDDIDRMGKEVVADLGGVDVLVNNAGRSIRRSIKLSFDRFHDFERTMELNYFGAVRLVLTLLPSMCENKRGQIINISSIGVQTNTPRFSAYVASKSALDAFSRCIASEVIDDNVHITTIYMPLVRTDMIAPTKMYDNFPTLSVEEASELITGAMINRPKKVATGLGNFGEVLYAVAPKVSDQVLHQAYRLFPDSSAAKGDKAKTSQDGKDGTSTEGVAFAHLLKGVHW